MTGYWSGYQLYRYGDRTPRRKERRILKGERRDHVVARVTAILRTWTFSPFQYEASCRNGLRLAFILKGYSWQRSNDEALAIVAEALANLRAKRPTWEEGQREYSTPREDCNYCGGPLDETHVTRGQRFCSKDCAKFALINRDYEWSWRADNTAWSAYRLIRRDDMPKKRCVHCGSVFHPSMNNPDQKYCSQACVGLSQRSRPLATCEVCGDEFRPPSTLPARFCSQECYSVHQRCRAPTLMLKCSCCGQTFLAKTQKTKCCSPQCANTLRALRKNAAKVLTWRVFDHCFAMAA